MKERKTWIDGLRALAMLFVIYGHIATGLRPYFLFSSPIKLPLFFAVTGFVFSFKGGDIRTFFKSIFRTLALPWLIFGTAYTIFKIITGVQPAEALYEFYTGQVAWYIPCLFIAEIIFFFIRRQAKPLWLQYALMCALAAAGYFITRIDNMACTFFGRSLIAQLYLLIGYAFRNMDHKFEKPRLLPAAFGAIYIALGVYLLVSGKGGMDVQHNVYNQPLLCLIMIICGCAFLFAYARFIKTPRWLVFIGQNTLIFYFFHARILDFIEPLFLRVIPGIRENIYIRLASSLVMCALLCAICTVCSLLINRFLPELAGRRRIKAK